MSTVLTPVRRPDVPAGPPLGRVRRLPVGARFPRWSPSAELAYLTVRELGMELVAVIDPSEIGKFCVEHRIEGPAWLANGTAFDVILDLKPPKEQNATREQLKPYLDGEKHQVVTCLW